MFDISIKLMCPIPVFIQFKESKDGASEEEEKQGENGKKEEERAREAEPERETEKTDTEMGVYCIYNTY